MILESERRAIVETLLLQMLVGHHSLDLPNARVDYSGAGGPVLSGAETASWLEKNMAPLKILQHFLSNVRVSQEGETVRSSAYVLAVHGYEDATRTMRFFDLGGEYQDRLVETSAGWRISERVLITRWLRGDPLGTIT